MHSDPVLNPYQSPEEPIEAQLADDLPAPAGAISFRGCVTLQEALEADRILLPWQRFQLFAWSTVLTVLTGYCLFSLVKSIVQQEVFLGGMMGAFIFGGVLAAIVSTRLMYLRKARQLSQQGFGVYCHTTGYVSPTEIHSRTDVAQSTILWAAFRGYKASPRVVIMYWTNSPGFLIFTRGKFGTDEKWQRFLGMVAERLPSLGTSG